MKNRKGLTLIEVILSMLILSILLVTYITVFGQNAVFVSKGKWITNETFNYQDIMENNMVNIKKEFTSGGLVADDKITIFSGEYRSEIDVKKVETEITNNRKFTAFVSNFIIKEPEPPKLDPFKVKVYDKNKTGEVFPWKDDKIRLIAKYTVKNDPLIFEKRTRWYGSTVGEKNPVFASDYEVLSEEEKQEPESTSYTKELVAEKVEAKKFYYFEARAYTLAGRMEHFRNEDRILILNRAGSKVWQDFMEAIYFDKLNKTDVVKKFDFSNKKTYLDIMQNPDHPTLNLDWSENSNPEGALVGVEVPDIYAGKSFITSINFQFDNVALNNSTNLGIGMGLVNGNNTGVIIDLEPLKDTISVRTTHKGKYENNGLINKMNTKNDLAFDAFRVKNGGLFDWSKEYSLIIQYHGEKLIIQLENEEIISKPLEIDLKDKNIEPKYIGLKSYSNIDYMPDLKHEIYNKYDRNYSSHFYNIDFKELDKDWVIDGEDDDYFYNGESSTLTGNDHPGLKIKLTRENTKLAGDRKDFIAKGLWFAEEIVGLEIMNHTLSIKAEEVIFDIPIKFNKDSDKIEISAIKDGPYPIKVYFRKGQRLRIGNLEPTTIEGDQYLSIKSGTAILQGNDTINITGDVEILP